jgi:hypothetical protein
MIAYFISFVLGFISFFTIDLISKMIKLNNTKLEYNSMFNELSKSIGFSSLSFISRVNNSIFFKFKSSKGVYDVILNIDINQINIIQNNKVIFGSDDLLQNKRIVDSNKISNIIYDIQIEIPEVNDVVAVSGGIIDRKTYNKTISDIKEDLDIKNSNKTENIKIPHDETTLNLDDILDKINEVGIEGLTEDEKIFLKNQSKK